MGLLDFFKRGDESPGIDLSPVDRALDGAARAGIDVSAVRDALIAWSGSGEDRTGGYSYRAEHDGGLLIADVTGDAVRLRFWTRKGAPDVEFSYSGEPSCAINYARVYGERII